MTYLLLVFEVVYFFQSRHNYHFNLALVKHCQSGGKTTLELLQSMKDIDSTGLTLISRALS